MPADVWKSKGNLDETCRFTRSLNGVDVERVSFLMGESKAHYFLIRYHLI